MSRRIKKGKKEVLKFKSCMNLERGGGARIENNFSEFFPLKFKLFPIIETPGKIPETIGENMVP